MLAFFDDHEYLTEKWLTALFDAMRVKNLNGTIPSQFLFALRASLGEISLLIAAMLPVCKTKHFGVMVKTFIF